jgi:hypothetical protein
MNAKESKKMRKKAKQLVADRLSLGYSLFAKAANGWPLRIRCAIAWKLIAGTLPETMRFEQRGR